MNRVTQLKKRNLQFIKLEDKNLYTYYHFVLECDENEGDKRFGIWANGILSETTPRNIMNKIELFYLDISRINKNKNESSIYETIFRENYW